MFCMEDRTKGGGKKKVSCKCQTCALRKLSPGATKFQYDLVDMPIPNFVEPRKAKEICRPISLTKDKDEIKTIKHQSPEISFANILTQVR